MKKLFLALLFCLPLMAEETVILENLKGILLLGEWDLVKKEAISDVDGVEAIDVGLAAANKDLVADLQYKFIGKPLTQTGIAEIKQSIIDFYASNNQPLVVVNTPKQEVTGGVLQLVVTEAKLGEIRTVGNQYFSTKQLTKYLRVKPGEAIVSKELREDLAFMNQNPFRRTDAVLKPGMRPGVADLELLTLDRWPYRFYVGADNTGTIPTQRDRIFAGFNLGKTVIEDTEVSFQYTQSPNINLFYSLTGLVRIPLPWFRHTIQGYGGYAAVAPKSGVTHLKPEGDSWQVDLRYRIPLFEGNHAGFLHTLVLGYDFKEAKSTLFFGGVNDYQGLADINQVLIGYDFGYRTKSLKLSFVGELYGSPGDITNHNNMRSFQTLRFGANARYAYFKLNHSLMQEFAGWRFSYDLRGQIASTNLLPSEQLCMTGYHAVRGFEERILILDNAALFTVTLETPRVSPARLLGWKQHYDELYVTAFCDTGCGRNHTQSPGEADFQSLGSIGPSLRYELGRYVSAHLDYGFQLWHSGFNAIDDSRYNFGVVVSF